MSVEDLNLRLSVDVGKITESSREGFDLIASAFNLCACQMVPRGLLDLPVLLSISY